MATTVRVTLDHAKDTLDAFLRIVRPHAADRDPVTGICDQILEMRHALDNGDA